MNSIYLNLKTYRVLILRLYLMNLNKSFLIRRKQYYYGGKTTSRQNANLLNHLRIIQVLPPA